MIPIKGSNRALHKSKREWKEENLDLDMAMEREEELFESPWPSTPWWEGREVWERPTMVLASLWLLALWERRKREGRTMLSKVRLRQKALRINFFLYHKVWLRRKACLRWVRHFLYLKRDAFILVKIYTFILNQDAIKVRLSS